MSQSDRISSRRVRNALRLLVLDEHPGSRRMMSFVAASRGHRVAAVESADQALETVAELRPDAVIYDWNQRGGPLRGFAHDVRSRCPGLRGVVVTSCLDEPPEFQTDEGVDSYFTKPVVMAEVIVRLELIVRSR